MFSVTNHKVLWKFLIKHVYYKDVILSCEYKYLGLGMNWQMHRKVVTICQEKTLTILIAPYRLFYSG